MRSGTHVSRIQDLLTKSINRQGLGSIGTRYRRDSRYWKNDKTEIMARRALMTRRGMDGKKLGKKVYIYGIYGPRRCSCQIIFIQWRRKGQYIMISNSNHHSNPMNSVPMSILPDATITQEDNGHYSFSRVDGRFAP
jgi:hypothetical protein